jgi:hypothetical protein
MKLGLLSYSLSSNLGDEIQALAVLQHAASKEVVFVDRDHLSSYSGEPCAVVMNGWFAIRPETFPPSDRIKPIFFGFHLAEKVADSFEVFRDYFKRHEPIGCRDHGTVAKLQSWGVAAYFSGCATMTFPERAQSGSQDLDFAVDVAKKSFEKPMRRKMTYVTQEASSSYLPTSLKMEIASQLLALYRHRAKTVVTSRIHCAMPCAAMGIPVLFCGPEDYRTDVVRQLGIPRKAPTWFSGIHADDLSLEKVEYAALKAKVTAQLLDVMERNGIATVPVNG